MSNEIKLTQFAKGAGCGCKIAPAVLEQILASNHVNQPQGNILVGNAHNDDAAVYDLDNGQALVITADFFMPIVDDAFTFGKVAAANAISDVYAMGGKPITAIALLGWPIDKLPAELAAKVMDGARETCAEAGIIISGGHTVDAAEPFFGLSVNGLVAISNIKRNNTAQAGDVILLSKPIGVGILATAQKRGLLMPAHKQQLVNQLTTLNNFGETLGKEKAVTALTDVTGFGLLGHLTEMCGEAISVELNYDDIPKLSSALGYLKQGIVPDASYRNWNAYASHVAIAPHLDPMESFGILTDPQTNGGLLVAVRPENVNEVKELAKQSMVDLVKIGRFITQSEHCVDVV